MGKKDILLKSYLEDARRYADLWNGGVFCGRQMVKAEELEIISPVFSKAGGDIALEKTCDLVMRQDGGGQRFTMLVVENQETVDYGMPVRVMLEEALEYSRQLGRIMRENERRDKECREKELGSFYQDVGERLYKVKKNDRIFPVATLVVYWGKKEWQGAKSLHDILDFGHKAALRTDDMKKLVPEYPLHFLDLARFKHYEYFQTELRPLLELYGKRNDKKEFAKYLKEDEMIGRMDDESWYVLSQLTNSVQLKKLMKSKKEKKNGGKTMCKAIDDMIKDAKEEGRIEGNIEGRIRGKAEDIFALLEELGVIPEDVKERIMEQKDMSILNNWLKMAAKADNMDMFVSRM